MATKVFGFTKPNHLSIVCDNCGDYIGEDVMEDYYYAHERQYDDVKCIKCVASSKPSANVHLGVSGTIDCFSKYYGRYASGINYRSNPTSG